VIVKRRANFYVWKVFVPLLIMTLIPKVVFWIDVKEFDWMLKVPMTMLLAMVPFEFVVSRDLPLIGYVTLLDAVFLAGFIFLRGLHRRDSGCFYLAAQREARGGGTIAPIRPLGVSAGIFFRARNSFGLLFAMN
jgi:hypothetical protein